MKTVVKISVLICCLGVFNAHAAGIMQLLKSVKEGEQVKITYSSKGCFHSKLYEFVIANIEDTRPCVSVRCVHDSAKEKATQEGATMGMVFLTTNDQKRLTALFEYYDKSGDHGACTTVNSVVIQRVLKDKVIATVDVVDENCELGDRTDILTFDEIIERVEHPKKQNTANQALQHNDPSCHVSCLRTPRASRGRG